MAFPTNKSALDARWSDIQLVIDTLTGVSGGGDQIQLTQYNNSSNYALDVRNLDTTNGYGLRVRDGASAALLTVAKNAIGIGGSAADVLTLTGRVSAASLTHSPGSGVVGVLVNIGGTLTEFSGGTHARLSVMELAVPTITAGAGAVTDASTLYIAGPPAASGASNWALWVDAGISKFDGALHAADGTVSLPGLAFAGDTDCGLYRIGANNLGIAVNGAKVLDIGTAGLDITGRISATTLSFINDTANTNMTLGLTINQAGNDDEILALKSSDVAHGIISRCETDTYGRFLKTVAATGGLGIDGLSAGTRGMTLNGIHATDNTAKTIAADAAIYLNGGLKSGENITDLGANANIVAIGNNGTTRFIFDADGDSHQDVGTAWTNFDNYDDIAMLTDLSVAVSREHDPIRREFGEFLKYNRDVLTKAKIVTFNADGHHFINWNRTHMLVIGALRQIGKRLESVEQQVHLLPSGG